jgi:hypothetical protein
VDETIPLFNTESGCGGREMRERLPPAPGACWWATTKLGIAIYDIPGKGVTARLILARPQASLRGEAHLTDDLAKAACMTSYFRRSPS